MTSYAYYAFYYGSRQAPVNAMRSLADRFWFTVVFLLNELFITVHVDDILNT